jgi:uncharacterized protein (DUF1778 family)
MARRKTMVLQVRVTEREKAIAEAAAQAEGRTVSNYILRLIMLDAANRGLLNDRPRRTGDE